MTERFVETISTGIISDTVTGKEYNCEYRVSNDFIELINQLAGENEQLKRALRDYHNAFDCSQCRYQNYNWYDDGDEFEVCDKGNNEAQMEYHSCKDWEEL